jgi:transposase
MAQRTKVAKETWLAIKTCYLAGMSTNDIAAKFEINRNTISIKAWKMGWNKLRRLPDSVPTDKALVEKVADMLETDWKTKGSAHRRLVFEKANSALREANLPAPRTWKDAQIADSMARKAAGLEDAENTKSTIVNVGWLQQTAGGAVTRLDIESDIVDAEVVEDAEILSD